LYEGPRAADMIASMRPRTAHIILVLVLLSSPAVADTIALRAGAILDVNAGKIVKNQTILVEGATIRAIGADIPISPDTTVVDLSNLTVMPGLFDAHTHLCIRTRSLADKLGIEVLDAVLLDPPGYRAIQGIAYAREMLDAGFTTVRDVGNAGRYIDVDVQRAIREGLAPGPTMLVSGRILAPFGGQFRARVDKSLLDNGEYAFADTHDEIRKAIRENVYYGANLIKVVADGKPYSYSTDDLRFIVDEARQAGVRVAIHCQTAGCERRAAEAAPASIEHAWSLNDPQTIDLIRKNGITLVTTDFTEKVLRAFGWDEDGAHRRHEARVDRLRHAYAAGIPIAFGSDIMVDIPGETRGTAAVSYVDSFVEAGIPNAEILRIFTSNAARLIGVEKERGTIAVGMAADLVAVPSNPLDDARALKSIVFVMKDGRIQRSPRSH
jgi:imidazolonepropionase-like amidohydrolase